MVSTLGIKILFGNYLVIQTGSTIFKFIDAIEIGLFHVCFKQNHLNSKMLLTAWKHEERK